MSRSRTQGSDAVRLEPAAPRSRVKHCTTESLCSLSDALADFHTAVDTRHEHVFLYYDSYLVTTVFLPDG